MAAPWQHLLSNFAVVALVVSLWTQCRDWTETWTALRQNLAFGLLMGIGAGGVMSFPFELRPGVFVDLRSAFTAVSGLFGGPAAATVSAAVAICLPRRTRRIRSMGRLHGPGAVIRDRRAGPLSDRRPDAGPAFHCAIFRRGGSERRRHISIPQALWTDVFTHVVLPLAVLLFVSTAVSALAIVQEQRRRDVFRTNHLYRTVTESLPDCLNIKDLEGRFLIANPATAELMKASTPEDLIGKTDFDFYPEATAEMFRREGWPSSRAARRRRSSRSSSGPTLR